MFEAIFSWNALYIILAFVYVIVCLGLIAVVLLQKGKGVSFAGAFGLGAGGDAVFGPRASRSLPVKLTQIGAGLFLILAFSLSVLGGVMARGAAPAQVTEEMVDPLQDLGIGEAAPALSDEAVREGLEEVLPIPDAQGPEAPLTVPEALEEGAAGQPTGEAPAMAPIETQEETPAAPPAESETAEQ